MFLLSKIESQLGFTGLAYFTGQALDSGILFEGDFQRKVIFTNQLREFTCGAFYLFGMPFHEGRLSLLNVAESFR